MEEMEEREIIKVQVLVQEEQDKEVLQEALAVLRALCMPVVVQVVLYLDMLKEQVVLAAGVLEVQIVLVGQELQILAEAAEVAAAVIPVAETPITQSLLAAEQAALAL